MKEYREDCFIEGGQNLTRVFGARLWRIELRDDYLAEKEGGGLNACLLPCCMETWNKFVEPKEKEFFQIQEAVNNIWCESSDVKDFAKRLNAARIADRFFEEVEFNEEKTNGDKMFAMYDFKPGDKLRKELPFLDEYNLQLYESGASLFPSFSSYASNETVGVVAQEINKFANVSDIFTRTWAKFSNPYEFLQEMKRAGFVEEFFAYVYDEDEDYWELEDEYFK